MKRGGGGGAGVLHRGQAGLDPALTLDRVAALVAGVHVVPGPLLVGRRELAVQERTDPRTEVSDHRADHDVDP